jgi:hypothetical protein
VRDVKGNWKDLLSAYSLALDCKKIYLGLVAVLLTLAVMTISSVLYYVAGGPDAGVRALGAFDSLSFLPMWVVCGHGLSAVGEFLPLLNPLGGNYVHFFVSLFFWILWLWCIARYCGPITRLAALEYARDDIPSLREARALYQRKWRAYYFAPMAPLLAIGGLALLNLIAGLFARIPYVGGWLLLPGYIFVIPFAIVLVFIAVFGLISFGLMFPAISIDGREAFDGWSRAYSYLLWGVNRFVGYVALAGALGIVAVLVAWGLGEASICGTVKSVRLGLGSRVRWVEYHRTYKDEAGLLQAIGAVPTRTVTRRQMVSERAAGGPEAAERLYYPAQPGSGRYRVLKIGPSAPRVRGPVLLPGMRGEPRTGLVLSGWIAYIALLGIRGLVAGYAVAYFFSAFTIVYFLMRKHIDRVDVTDVYLDEEEEGEEEEIEPLEAEELEAEEAEAAGIAEEIEEIEEIEEETEEEAGEAAEEKAKEGPDKGKPAGTAKKKSTTRKKKSGGTKKKRQTKGTSRKKKKGGS